MAFGDWRHHHVYATQIVWSRRRTGRGRRHIIVTPIKHVEFEGIRVSPSGYTTPEELDRFGDAMEFAIKNGVRTS